MRAIIIALIFAVSIGRPGSANTITDYFTSFYVLGDSLSDDGNITGTLWRWITGGAPYVGNWRDGGTFTNGDVWNEGLQNDFRNAGRDADNFAVGRAAASGGNWLLPDLDGQIDKLLDYTSSGDRGSRGLAAVWIGGINVIQAVGEDNAMTTARKAAKSVADGLRRLSSKAGIDDFLVLNLPNLARIPKFRLFEPDLKLDAKAAGKAYNAELARNIRSLERDGLNVIDIDVFSLFNDVLADPGGFGFSNVRLPCVFPSDSAADKYDQPRRCSSSIANERFFIDEMHPNKQAHRIIADVVEDALEAEVLARTSTAAVRIVPNPVPGSMTLVLVALGTAAALGAALRLRPIRALA